MDNYAITTIITPASSFDLTTLENVKLDLSITTTDEDMWLETRAIPQVSGIVSQDCNRIFAKQTYQDVIHPQRDPRPYFLPNGRQPMYVRKVPLLSVASVTEKDIALVSGTDYEVDYENSYVYRLDEFGYPKPWPAYKIVITYDAGFVLPGNTGSTLPADLEGAVISIIKAVRFNRTRDPLLRSEDILNGLYSYSLFSQADMPAGTADQVKTILDNYRISAFA